MLRRQHVIEILPPPLPSPPGHHPPNQFEFRNATQPTVRTSYLGCSCLFVESADPFSLQYEHRPNMTLKSIERDNEGDILREQTEDQVVKRGGLCLDKWRRRDGT